MGKFSLSFLHALQLLSELQRLEPEVHQLDSVATRCSSEGVAPALYLLLHRPCDRETVQGSQLLQRRRPAEHAFRRQTACLAGVRLRPKLRQLLLLLQLQLRHLQDGVDLGQLSPILDLISFSLALLLLQLLQK